MSVKLEIGKKYRYKDHTIIRTCVGHATDGNFILENPDQTIYKTFSPENYIEYQEPKKVYLNIVEYKTRLGSEITTRRLGYAYPSKQLADSVKSNLSMKIVARCIEVEYHDGDGVE